MKIYKIEQDFDNYKFFVFKEDEEANKDVWDIKVNHSLTGGKNLV